MTVSNSTDYIETRATIIKDALLHLKVIDPDESVDAAIGELMNRQLNRMVKAWQVNGVNLWKKSIGILFLEPNVSEYTFSQTSTNNYTEENYKYTTTTADELTGSNQLYLASLSGIAVGSKLGIMLDSGTIFWVEVSNVGLDFVLFDPDVLPSEVSTGNRVIYYSNKFETPYSIISVNRYDINSNIEIPLTYTSYKDFFEIPEKTSSSIPTLYNYDSRLDSMILRIWQAPSDYSNYLKLIVEKTIFDFDNASNNPDFPTEWSDAICFNLAVRSASFFGKNVGESFINLKNLADTSLDLVNMGDNEEGSLIFTPSFR